MAQDIRKMLREERELSSEKLRKGHLKRFEQRLDKNLPQEGEKRNNNRFFFLKIAAVLVVVFGVGAIFYFGNNDTMQPQVVEQQVEEEINTEPGQPEYRLSDVSPEFRKIENFYMANLNVELAKLKVDDENKALVDSFMVQLAELDREYKRLNLEISESGLSESSVEALIKNLQLRLELLNKLKTKINDIKEPKNNNYEDFQA